MMNTALGRHLRLSFALVWLVSSAWAFGQNPRPTPIQLAPGKSAGTFAFQFTSRITFTQEPAFPVIVTIANGYPKTVVQLEVADDSPFTIAADLPPGTYMVNALAAGGKDSAYMPAWGPGYFIDPQGLLTNTSFVDTLLSFKKRINLISPDLGGTATVDDPRPLFKWEPLAGAMGYSVGWGAMASNTKTDPEAKGTIDTRESECYLPQALIPGRRYQWHVQALGPKGQILGMSTYCDFYTPGGLAAFEARPSGTPKSGVPFFGVVQIPGEKSAHSEFGGVVVVSVLPDSSALKAGILPNDLLTSFDGKSLEGFSQMEFVRLIQGTTVGAKVDVVLRRNGAEITLPVIIEAKQ